MANKRLSVKVGFRFDEADKLQIQAQSLLDTISKKLNISVGEINISNVQKALSTVEGQVKSIGDKSSLKINIDQENTKKQMAQYKGVIDNFLNSLNFSDKKKKDMFGKELLGNVNDFVKMSEIVEKIKVTLSEDYENSQVISSLKTEKEQCEALRKEYEGLANYLKNTKVTMDGSKLDKDMKKQISDGLRGSNFMNFKDKSRMDIDRVGNELIGKFPQFFSEEHIKTQEDLAIRCSKLYDEYKQLKKGTMPTSNNGFSLTSDENFERASRMADNGANKMLGAIVDIQEGAVKITTTTTNAVKTSTEAIRTTNEAYSREIDILQRKANEMKSMGKQVMNVKTDVSPETGEVVGGRITYKIDEARQKVEQFSLVTRETANGVEEMLTKTGSYFTYNGQKVDQLAKSTENYISRQEEKLKNLANQNMKFANSNPNANNGDILNQTNALLDMYSRIRREGKILSDEDKARMGEMYSDLKRLSDMKESIAKQDLSDSKKTEAIMKANIQWAEAQTKKLAEIKSSSTKYKEKDGDYDTTYVYQQVEALVNRINQAKARGVDLTLEEQIAINRLVSELKIKNNELINQQRVKTQNTKNENKEIEKSLTFLSSQISALEKMKTKLSMASGSSPERTALIGQIDTQIAKLNQLKNTGVAVENAQQIEIKETTQAYQREMMAIGNVTGKLGRTMATVMSYAFGGSIIYTGIAQIRQALNTIKELDTAFTDLSITMNISSSQFTGFTREIQSLASGLGTTVENVMDVARVYANATTSIDEIMQKVQPSVALANVSRMTGAEVTKTVQSALNQFKLLADGTNTVEEATTRVGDALVSVSQNMAYDFGSGIQEMVEAIKTAGSVADASGQSLESYIGLMGMMIQNTGKSGSELANAYKMITARVHQIKGLGDEMGVTADDMAKAEKELASLNISIRDSEGGLVAVDEVLRQNAEAWKTMTDQEKSANAEAMAG